MGLKEEIINLICETLEVKAEEIKDGVKLYDSIGVDSTEMVELVIALKKKFDLPLETSEITKFSTPEEIVSTIEGKKN